MTLRNRVLVVDDDSEIRETVVELLEERGFEAVGAADGVEALAKLRGPEDRWGVVLLDMMMPNMDGRTFRQHQLLDPALAKIPVVIVSAMRGVDETAAELQAAGHFSKPVRLAELLAVVGRFCPVA